MGSAGQRLSSMPITVLRHRLFSLLVGYISGLDTSPLFFSTSFASSHYSNQPTKPPNHRSTDQHELDRRPLSIPLPIFPFKQRGRSEQLFRRCRGKPRHKHPIWRRGQFDCDYRPWLWPVGQLWRQQRCSQRQVVSFQPLISVMNVDSDRHLLETLKDNGGGWTQGW